MAKNSVRDFDATAANNTDIQSVDIAENCAPSGINNAIRELMADIKDVSSGTIALESPQADSLTVTGDLTVDTDTLFVDASADAVGIGTTSLTAARVLTVNHATAPTQSFEQNGTEKHLSGIAGSASFGINGSASGDYFARTSGGKMLFSTDTGTTAHATLDGSGNLLVGTTTLSTNTDGHELRSDGKLVSSTSGAAVAYFNRNTDDGQIIRLDKDGTTVGSINSRGGEFIAIGYSDTYLEFNAGSNQINPSTGSAARDNAIDLGNAFARFNDLYLGGSVYLGGTAAANALDDYEEGTFTPANAYVTISVNSAAYVKAGNIVIYRFDISFPTNSNTNIAALTGFPFNSPPYNGGFTHWTTYGAPPPIHLSGTTAYVQNPASASSTLQLQNLSGKRIICNAVVSMT